jgi:hypothetical protein
VGTNVAYHDKNWDLALVGDYATLADLEAYRVHPAHQRVVELVKTRVSQRASLDFEL